MLDGGYEFHEMLAVVIRGMREEESVKHRLLEKFDEGEINNFEQLRRLYPLHGHQRKRIVGLDGHLSVEPGVENGSTRRPNHLSRDSR